MSLLLNIFIAPIARVLNFLSGFIGLVRLLWIGLKALFGKGGTIGSRIGDAFVLASSQRAVFSVLRAFMPNFVLKMKFVTSYENTGTAVVTRRKDVMALLDKNADFAVVYGPRMMEITGGANFFLGMQPSWDYTRDTSAMHLAMRTTDVEQIVLPLANQIAGDAVATADGTIDLVQDVGLAVSTEIVSKYFGMPGPSKEELIEWTTTLFWYLFIDLNTDETLGKKARSIMPEFRKYLDAQIMKRKNSKAKKKTDDVTNRCLALQSADTPGMSDEGIRNNLVGLMIGAVPTLSKAAALALEELFRRPDALRMAQEAARKSDDALLAKICWEALRFNPHQPVIYRRATRDVKIAKSTLRQRTIPEGTMVFAANLSASFDMLDVKSPNQFLTDRQDNLYMTWGYGMHTCFGAAINRAVIPAILKPVLQKTGLRYADGVSEIDTGGTPFPVHMKLAFDKD